MTFSSSRSNAIPSKSSVWDAQMNVTCFSICVLCAMFRALGSIGQGGALFRRLPRSAVMSSLVVLVALLSPTKTANADLVANSLAESAPKRLIVKLRTPSSGSFLQKSGFAREKNSQFTKIAAEAGAVSIGSLFGPETVTRGFPGDVRILTFDRDADLAGLIEKFEQAKDVEYAEPDYRIELFISPNDPLYARQWSLHNTGQGYWHVVRNPGYGDDQMMIDSGLVGADINADGFLSNPPDGVEVVMAIIDTGIDPHHPDLAGRLWINTDEIEGNGIDDDHNGYIDDVHGWDFSGNDSTWIPIREDNDPSDHHGHGTHVTGIVAATPDNGIGITGVAARCRVMSLKIHPMMLASMAARAIVYAADNGADVINMSWGSTFPMKLVEDAVDYASKKGVILCAASGNSGTQVESYPAALPEVISVGATDSRDHVTAFSTYGPSVDVVAPGESILSLRADSTDMYAIAPSFEPRVHIVEDIYYEASGTSMACPIVAAIACCLRSVSPGISPAKSQMIIQQSAHDLVDPYADGQALAGRDNFSGYGRVDLERALSLAPSVRAQITSPISNQILNGVVEVFGTADGAAFGGYVLEYGEGDDPSGWNAILSSSSPVTGATLATWNTSALAGRYTLRLRAGEDNRSQVTLVIANGVYAEITYPTNDDTISNSVAIAGSALAPNFLFATLEYSAVSEPNNWNLIDTLLQPTYHSRILEWNVSALQDGLYKLRLTVHTNHDIHQRSVTVRVLSPFSGVDGWRVRTGGVPTIVPNYGDFNGDGINEIVVGTSDGVKFFSTSGSPLLEGMPALDELDFRTPIAVGRLNSDGIDDFVAVSDNPSQLFIVRSKQAVKSVMLPVTSQVGFFDYNDEGKFPVLFLKDIDGDGIDEIHYLSSGERWNRRFFIFRSNGQSWSPRTDFNYIERCLPADLNGDGIDEIYCLSDSLREYDLSGAQTSAVPLNLASFFVPQGISTADIDRDGRYELMVFGRYPWSVNLQQYWLFAFGAHLILEDSWPREIRINRDLKPNMPVFGDLDGDSSIEYTTSCFDLDFGSVYAWRYDGQPYYGDSTANGFFAAMPEPSMLNMPVLAALDSSRGEEIISCALPDAWGTSDRQSIVAWTSTSQLLSGWPLVVAVSPVSTNDYANTPVIGDINQDGNVDLMMTTMLGDLVFLNLPNHPWRPEISSCPMWRYNRRLNNTAPPFAAIPLDVVDGDASGSLPREFALEQNYPNPFNSSTVICYSLPRPAPVRIEILNILGQVARSFDIGIRSSGRYTLEWDGKNDRGEQVASGLYFYRLFAGSQNVVKKMILLK